MLYTLRSRSYRFCCLREVRWWGFSGMICIPNNWRYCSSYLSSGSPRTSPVSVCSVWGGFLATTNMEYSVWCSNAAPTPNTWTLSNRNFFGLYRLHIASFLCYSSFKPYSIYPTLLLLTLKRYIYYFNR